MNHEELQTALYEKVAAEQKAFRDQLYAQPTREALDHTAEYTIREDILIALEGAELEDAQLRALLASPTPLEDIYRVHDKMETSRMDEIRSCILDRADTVLSQQKDLPVYKYPGEYAREHGELELYRASGKANLACKTAIEDAINRHYRDNSLDTKAAVREVVEQFGYERMLYVLAVTVRHMDWDGRISRGNKDWARTIPVFENPDGFGLDRNTAFVVSRSHPGLTDLFVTAARREYLLTLPLTKEDIQREALSILSRLQNAREPNSPSGTHFMAQISPDFLARASSRDQDKLMKLLPFQSLTFSGLQDRKGLYAMISKDEDRNQPLRRGRSSVRSKLKHTQAAPKPQAAAKKKERER